MYAPNATTLTANESTTILTICSTYSTFWSVNNLATSNVLTKSIAVDNDVIPL